MLRIGSLTIPHQLIMAPMCGITHQAFRRVCKEYGAGLVLTQMVSAKALTMRDSKTHFLLSYDEGERPVGFQLFGKDAETLGEAARICQEMGADLVDLNMGCPAKKIVNDGGGSALLKEPEKARQIFEAMRKNLTIPFTVKMRAGWDKYSGESLEIAKIAEDCGVDAITLHARTKEQGYSGKAEWDMIREFKEALTIPVIGNGDVNNLDDIHRMLAETGCDGVMIGRGRVAAPWLFRSFVTGTQTELNPEEIGELILKQYGYFIEFFGERSGIKQMRKHLCAYTKGMRNGAEFRNKMFGMEDWNQLKETIVPFFRSDP